MIRLHGFAVSNYYNKVKLALLEKGVPFEEVKFLPGSADVRSLSPLQKVPFLETPQGSLCESQVILDWLEAAWPSPALLPADPWQAAKVRELNTFLELHLELVIRQVYGQAFFGVSLPDSLRTRVRRQMDNTLPALRQLMRFEPYIAGADFTMADCTAYAHLPTAAQACKLVFGEDLLLAHGIDWKGYLRLIEQRPSAQRVSADRKADRDSVAHITALAARAAGGA